jgi:hypothetical protein
MLLFMLTEETPLTRVGRLLGSNSRSGGSSAIGSSGSGSSGSSGGNSSGSVERGGARGSGIGDSSSNGSHGQLQQVRTIQSQNNRLLQLSFTIIWMSHFYLNFARCPYFFSNLLHEYRQSSHI